MADEANKNEEQVTSTEETEEKVTPTEEAEEEQEKQPTRKEILRELSKEHGINLFDAEGLKEFKEYQESQKSEQEKLQEELQEYQSKEEEWQSEKLKYESKLKASELGIHPNNMEDALKLADNNPDNLEKVVKKYPVFKSKEGVKIGMQSPENKEEPTSKSEQEAYMAQYPRIYGGKK